MTRRRSRALIAVAAGVLAGASPAPAAGAATHAIAYAPAAKIGPVLSGDSVAWGEGREPFSQLGRFRLRIADPGGLIRTVALDPDRAGARPEWDRLLGGPGGIAFAYDVLRDDRDPFEPAEIRKRVSAVRTAAGVLRNVEGRPLHVSGTTLLVVRGESTTNLVEVDLTGAAPNRDITPAGLDPNLGIRAARIAGDLLAVSRELVPGPNDEDDLNGDVEISLYRRSTRARIYVKRFPPAVFTIADLAPDGRLLVAEQLPAVFAGTRRRLHYLDPSATPSLHPVAPLVTSGTAVIVGDEAIAQGPVGGRGAQPTAFPLAGGPPRLLGAPATAIADLDATADSVAWRTDDGCVLRAPIAAPADTALPPGACPRSALTFPPQQGLTANGKRVLRFRVGCPGAPPPGCRGTVTLRLRASRAGRAVRLAGARVTVPPGTTRGVALRLSRVANRIAARRGGDAQLRATIADPEGRTRTTSLEFFLEVPGTPPIPPIG